MTFARPYSFTHAKRERGASLPGKLVPCPMPLRLVGMLSRKLVMDEQAFSHVECTRDITCMYLVIIMTCLHYKKNIATSMPNSLQGA